MANESRLSVERLAEFLIYDPLSGALTWAPRHRARFTSDCAHKIWNSRFAGKPALNAKRPDGYLAGSVENVTYYAHRVCMALAFGAWPAGEVDHINGNRADNRLANLRDVSRGENCKNKQIGVRNKSGALGVLLDHTGKYRARITLDYQTVELGRYGTLEEASMVRRAAEETHSYHPNHGRKTLEAA